MQDARHFKSRGGHARHGQEGSGVHFDDFFHAVGDDDIARGGAAVAGHEHAFGVMKGKNGGGLGLNRRAVGRGGVARQKLLPGQKGKEVAGNFGVAHCPVRWR